MHIEFVHGSAYLLQGYVSVYGFTSNITLTQYDYEVEVGEEM